MTKTILQAALAARDAALDRTQLAVDARKIDSGRVAAVRGPRTVATQTGRVRPAVSAATPSMDSAAALVAGVDTTHAIVLDLPLRPEPSRTSPPPRGVPDVRGMSLREAVRSLHSAGFRVQLARATPSASGTEPAAGAVASAGSLVRLRYIR